MPPVLQTKRSWTDEICGLHAQMMRSDGRWYHILIEKFDPKDNVHLVTFYAQGHPTENKAEYDLRDTLRRIRFFDENGALMAEGKGPNLTNRRRSSLSNTQKGNISSIFSTTEERHKSIALVTVDVTSIEEKSSSLVVDVTNSKPFSFDSKGDETESEILQRVEKNVEEKEEEDENIISKNISMSSAASNSNAQILHLQSDILYVDSQTGHTFTVIDNESIPVFLPLPNVPASNISSQRRGKRPTPLEPPTGGWSLLQLSSKDPLKLLFKQIRLFWPTDNEWFSGRILDWDIKTDEYFIRYDDGDERWYDLKEREYTVVEECGSELIGRRLAIQFQKVTPQTNSNSTQAKHHLHSNDITKKEKGVHQHQHTHQLDSTPPRYVWRFAEVADYRPKLDMHLVVFNPLISKAQDTLTEDATISGVSSNIDDGETPVRSFSLSSFSSAVRSDELVLKLTTRPFFLLADPERIQPNEKLIGRRVLVLDKETGNLDAGVITNISSKTSSSSSSSSSSSTSVATLESIGNPSIRISSSSLLRIIFDHGLVLNAPWSSILFSFCDSDAIEGTPKVAGGVGLLNLGNTCYLNSVLQSLSHIDSLTRFFFHSSFSLHLNTTSKQGLQGRMALAMHDLFSILWGKDVLALAPSLVKALLSERNPQFHGMGQQDAQESLLCLLDALHEDLAEPDAAASAAAKKDAADAANEEAKDKKLKEQQTKQTSAAGGGGVGSGSVATSSGWGSLLLGPNKKKIESTKALSSGKIEEKGREVLSTSSTTSSSSSSSSSQPTERSFLETTSIIKRLFFVQTHVEYICQRNSKHVHYRHGPRGGELLPPLSLAQQKESFEGWLRKKIIKQPSLTDCISNYFTEETVERRCDQCAKTVKMSSRPWLKALPPVLVIHLKRFEYKEVPSLGHADRSEWTNVKLTTPIPFPLRGLDMSPYVSKKKERTTSSTTANTVSPISSSLLSSSSSSSSSSSLASGGGNRTTNNPTHSISSAASASSSSSSTSSTSSSQEQYDGEDDSSLYDLFSVVCHVGSAEQGHYTAFNRSSVNGDWCYYDDSVVVPALESEVSSEIAASLAYLLFYAKRPKGALPPALSPAAAERERLFQAKAKENMSKVLSANPLSSSSSSYMSSSKNIGESISSSMTANISLLLTGSATTLSSTWGLQGRNNSLFPSSNGHSHLNKADSGTAVTVGPKNDAVVPVAASNGLAMAFSNLPNH